MYEGESIWRIQLSVSNIDTNFQNLYSLVIVLRKINPYLFVILTPILATSLFSLCEKITHLFGKFWSTVTCSSIRRKSEEVSVREGHEGIPTDDRLVSDDGVGLLWQMTLLYTHTHSNILFGNKFSYRKTTKLSRRIDVRVLLLMVQKYNVILSSIISDKCIWCLLMQYFPIWIHNVKLNKNLDAEYMMGNH